MDPDKQVSSQKRLRIRAEHANVSAEAYCIPGRPGEQWLV